MKSEQSFVAGLVNTPTIGTYNPTDVPISCSAKKWEGKKLGPGTLRST